MKNNNEEEINNITNKLVNKINSKIGNNSNYMDWLEKFTLENPKFTDNDLLYKNKNIEDIDRINMLNSLYDLIENYAKQNYIYLYKISDYSGFYRIKYNNIGYEVGYLIGQETVYYCNRVNYIDNTFIDFNYIINNIKQPHTNEINEMIEELKIIIDNYYNRGIPVEALKRCVYESIKDLDNNESKVLKK